VKEIVEMKQRSLAEENQKTLEVLKERYSILRGRLVYVVSLEETVICHAFGWQQMEKSSILFIICF